MTDGAPSPSRFHRHALWTGIALAMAAGAAVGASHAQPPANSDSPAIVLPQAAPPPEVGAADFGRAARPATEPAAQTPAATSVPPRPTVPSLSAAPSVPIDWPAVPIEQLRARANAEDIPAMEELARRLVQGVGVPKDQQAGAGWLLRAAQGGSPIAAFNVAVMYERGFVVERDSARAVEWYRRAAEANMPMAKHNLALMLREGKGVARNGTEAIELLRTAARQGMPASMLALGDMYERGDVVPKDAAMALAWFAITAEFERQTSRGSGESSLSNTATQRAQALRRVLMPGELERAQQIGQSEFRQIVETLQPPKLPPPALPAPSFPVAATTKPAAPDADPPGWPAAVNDQIRVIQQALIELRYLRDKPDGAIGPVTRAAIRTFQRSMNLRDTGEPTKDVFAALQDTIAKRDAAQAAKPEVKSEAKSEPPKSEPTRAEPARAEPAKPSLVATIDVGRAEPPAPARPSPPTTVEAPKSAAPKAEAPMQKPATNAPINIGNPQPPPPPTSTDLATATTGDSDGWPATINEQVMAIQRLLHEVGLLKEEPDGLFGPTTREAIVAYETSAGLPARGEISEALFESLRDKRLQMGPQPN